LNGLKKEGRASVKSGRILERGADFGNNNFRGNVRGKRSAERQSLSFFRPKLYFAGRRQGFIMIMHSAVNMRRNAILF